MNFDYLYFIKNSMNKKEKYIMENKIQPDIYPFELSMNISKFECEKEYLKFVRNCEKLIRLSSEYKEWRQYIKNIMEFNYCVITEEISEHVSIEIHHHIPSLFIIVKTIINKYIHNNEEFCTFDVCKEVMKLHYLNKIGFIPLTKTIHEKFHSNNLDIPICLIKGNYEDFLNEYKDFIDDDDISIIDERKQIINNNNFNMLWKKDSYPGIIKINNNDKYLQN